MGENHTTSCQQLQHIVHLQPLHVLGGIIGMVGSVTWTKHFASQQFVDYIASKCLLTIYM